MNTNILLIEDDEQLGELLSTELSREAHECVWFRTMDGVTESINKNHPDIILLDLMLPDGSGYDLLKQIRGISDAPIIVISARILGEDKVRALDLGADDYVSKPFWINELSARIRAVMRRKNVDLSMTGEVMYVDSISVHFGSREVHKDGVTLLWLAGKYMAAKELSARPVLTVSRRIV